MIPYSNLSKPETRKFHESKLKILEPYILKYFNSKQNFKHRKLEKLYVTQNELSRTEDTVKLQKLSSYLAKLISQMNCKTYINFELTREK